RRASCATCTNGSIENDPPGGHRACTVSRAICALLRVPVGDAGARARADVVVVVGARLADHRGARPRGRQLRGDRPVRRGTAGLHLRSRAHRKREVRPGGGAVTAPAEPDGHTPNSLAQAEWLTRGPLPKLLAVLNRDHEEARAIGGAVR